MKYAIILFMFISVSAIADGPHISTPAPAESDPIAILPDGTRSMTADLQMGSNKIENVSELHFVPTNGSVATVEGDAYWDADDHTLELTTDIAGATLQVGQQFWMRAKKTAPTTISKGDAVYISGASGDKPLVALADSVTNSHVVGLAAHDWASNDGWITMEGREEDLDTSSYTAGDELFVSSVAGSLTNVSQFVGQGSVATVTRSHASAGQVFVSIVHSELEPAWNAVSNTVTAGAAAGATALQNVAEDTTPQLGGNLDANGGAITNLGTGVGGQGLGWQGGSLYTFPTSYELRNNNGVRWVHANEVGTFFDGTNANQIVDFSNMPILQDNNGIPQSQGTATTGDQIVNYQTMEAYVQDSWAESETVTYAATTTVLRTHGAYPWLYATGDCEITMEAGAWATNGIGIVGLTLYHTSSETITFDAASINATDAGALTLEPLTNQLFVLTKPRGETVWRIK